MEHPDAAAEDPLLEKLHEKFDEAHATGVRRGLIKGRLGGLARGLEFGREDGLREAVAIVLVARNLVLDETQRGWLRWECGASDLSRLLVRAATASTTEEVFGPAAPTGQLADPPPRS